MRIQVCGSIVVTVDGRRVEEDLPGRQGRLLLACLVVHRRRPLGRDGLIDALWGGRPPPHAESSLRALLSRVRRVLGDEVVRGRDAPRLLLPPDAFIDLEAAREAMHRAESAVSAGAWARAWAPARIALHTAARGFLPGVEGEWVDEVRHELEGMQLRAEECVGAIGLGMGGGELDAALRAGRRLIAAAPLHESGYRLLMEAYERRRDRGHALLVYDRLRVTLRDDLGTAPSADLQELHAQLLAAGATGTAR